MALPRLVHLITVPATMSLMRGQLEFCARAGFDVHLVAAFDREPPPLDANDAVTLHSVPMQRRPDVARDLVSLSRVCALLSRLRPDIVQAGTPKAALLGMLASRVLKTPVRIYHVRGLAHMSGSRPSALAAEGAERLCCALASHVLCVSESLKHVMVDKAFCAADKATVLLRGSSNGVDAADRFNPARLADARANVRQSLGIDERSIVIGFVGRLVRDKGILDLVAAWNRLRVEFPDVVLLLLGPFEVGDALAPRVRDALRADPRVRITQTRWGDAAPFYAAMDIVAFPSHREGFPNVPMEAGAMGLPVVAARVTGSIDAVVDGVTGILVPPRDPASLARALRGLLRDLPRARRLGVAGRLRALVDYRPADLWAAQVEWYRSLL